MNLPVQESVYFAVVVVVVAIVFVGRSSLMRAPIAHHTSAPRFDLIIPMCIDVEKGNLSLSIQLLISSLRPCYSSLIYD